MASKYDRLHHHLNTRTARSVVLSFREIERMLGSRLPPSARKYAEWWANEAEPTSHVQCRAWLRAGRKARVNLTAEMVEFSN
jgi:hypothetical protein